MGEFCRKDQLTALIVHQGDPGGSAARIKLDAQRPHPGRFDGSLEYDRKGVALEYGGFPGLEQQARSAGMHRVEWLFVCVYDKNMGHELLL